MDCIYPRAFMGTTGLFFHWLLAQINHYNALFQKSCPCLGWFELKGPVLHLPESTSLKNPGPRVHKTTGLKIWGTRLSLWWAVWPWTNRSPLGASLLTCKSEVSILDGVNNSLQHSIIELLDIFWNPRILPKWFHMNPGIMSANTLKYIFVILYIYFTIAWKRI